MEEYSMSEIMKYDNNYTWDVTDGEGGIYNFNLQHRGSMSGFTNPISLTYNENTGEVTEIIRINKDKQEFRNDTGPYAPYIEDVLSAIAPQSIKNDIPWGKDDNGKIYYGRDSIKKASDSGVLFVTASLKEDMALSRDGHLYTNMGDINRAARDGVTFDKVNIKSVDNYALADSGRLYIDRTFIDYAVMKGEKFTNGDVKIKDGMAIDDAGHLYAGRKQIIQAGDDNVFVKMEGNIKKNIDFIQDSEGKIHIGKNLQDKVIKVNDIKDVHISTSPYNLPDGQPFGMDKEGNVYVGEKAINDASSRGIAFTHADPLDLPYCVETNGRWHVGEQAVANQATTYKTFSIVDISHTKTIKDWSSRAQNFMANGSNLERIHPQNLKDAKLYSVDNTPLQRKAEAFVEKYREEKHQAVEDAKPKGFEKVTNWFKSKAMAIKDYVTGEHHEEKKEPVKFKPSIELRSMRDDFKHDFDVIHDNPEVIRHDINKISKHTPESVRDKLKEVAENIKNIPAPETQTQGKIKEEEEDFTHTL